MKTDQSFWHRTADTVSVTESGRTNSTSRSRRGSWKLSTLIVSEAVEMEEVAEAAEIEQTAVLSSCSWKPVLAVVLLLICWSFRTSTRSRTRSSRKLVELFKLLKKNKQELQEAVETSRSGWKPVTSSKPLNFDVEQAEEAFKNQQKLLKVEAAEGRVLK